MVRYHSKLRNLKQIAQGKIQMDRSDLQFPIQTFLDELSDIIVDDVINKLSDEKNNCNKNEREA